MKKALGVLLFILSFAAEAQENHAPAWSLQSNIYEVNLRQYTSEGTIKAFQKHLPRLKKMGVQILWFMPITPIGIEGRKMNESELGSYYAVRNYKQVNPDYGSMADWKMFVNVAHSMGFKVITDWVANHSSPDNPWIKSHPDFYAKDSTGKIISQYDWTDTRKLDYKSRELRDSMIDAMKFWITETGIDGYRCDIAGEVPNDFWKECISTLRKVKDVYMLAEGETPALHEAGFHTTYGWSLFHAFADIYAGKKTLLQFDSILNKNLADFPKQASRLYFTTNHDENSWNGTEFEKFGDAYKTIAVFTQTMYQSIPLIYSGQEIPNKKRLKFFVKDTLSWPSKPALAPFYTTLLHLRRNNPALASNANYQRIKTGNDANVFAFMRSSGKNKVLVILNLSSATQSFSMPANAVSTNLTDIFSRKTVNSSNLKNMRVPAWGHFVYSTSK